MAERPDDGICRHPTCGCQVSRAYRAGRAEEREACAQLAEQVAATTGDCDCGGHFCGADRDVADLIRARGHAVKRLGCALLALGWTVLVIGVPFWLLAR